MEPTTNRFEEKFLRKNWVKFMIMTLTDLIMCKQSVFFLESWLNLRIFIDSQILFYLNISPYTFLILDSNQDFDCKNLESWLKLRWNGHISWILLDDSTSTLLYPGSSWTVPSWIAKQCSLCSPHGQNQTDEGTKPSELIQVIPNLLK